MTQGFGHGRHFATEMLAARALTTAGFVRQSEAIMGGGCFWRGKEKAFIEKSKDVFFTRSGKYWKVVTQ